jgi:hypothetical protein
MEGVNNIIKNSEAVNQPSKMQTHFTLTKGSRTYNLILIIGAKAIDIKVRRVTRRENYEGKFSLNNLWDISDVFYMFHTLEDAHKDLVQKITEERVDFDEDKDRLNLLFTFNVNSANIDAVLQLNKGKDENVSLQVDELCETFLSNYEAIKGFQKTVSAQEKKIEKYEKTISAQGKDLEELHVIISSLQLELKLLKENGMKGLAYSQILEEEEIQQIKKWVDPTNYNKVHFKLLYRATEHGIGVNDFHRRCDNKVRYINNTYTYIIGSHHFLHKNKQW